MSDNGNLLPPRTIAELASLIDHTILRPSAVLDDILRAARDAKLWNVATLCVNSIWVPYAVEELADSDVEVCTVIGFPHGATNLHGLGGETRQASKDGATEFDFVIPIGMARMGRWERVEEAARVVKEESNGGIVKAILETCELGEMEIRAAIQATIAGGADYVKSSTGFGSRGATVEVVRLMAEIAGDKAGVKASGGIRTWDHARAMIEAGATRIGTSSTATILEEAKESLHS